MCRVDRWSAAALVAALAVVLGGCASGGSESTADRDEAPYLLQARITHAVPPEQQFDRLARVTITRDGVVVTAGAMPASFPGPLVAPLRGRTITGAGYDRIVAEAQAAGLLDGTVDPGGAMPGGLLAEVNLWVDGEMRTIHGDPNRVMQCVRAPCAAPPGTPEAFGAFWSGIQDLASVMAEELGPEERYVPEAYALLVGVPPIDDAGLGVQIAEWPLEAALGTLGQPIGAEAFPRCATVTGDDAATLGPSLEGANQLTQWADGDAAPVALRARPIVSGEDPCAEVFGVGG